MTEPRPNGVYRVVLRGRVPDRMLAPYLDEFDIDRSDATTTLTGTIVDPSQLHGLITHLTSTGVDIVELSPRGSAGPMKAIECTFPSSATTLAGTLTFGPEPASGPIALLISGSGRFDRDSNAKRFGIGVMAQVASHLAQAGVPSFRYDKRGVGVSGGDYYSTGFHDNVSDAQAALDLVCSVSDVDLDQVFVIGHSEGALIAIELAARNPSLAGIVLLAGMASSGEAVLRRQAEQLADGLPRTLQMLIRLLRLDIRRSQDKWLTRLGATTADSIRVGLINVNAKWFREFMAHDPSPSLAALQVPVLAITGSRDIQVDPDDVKRICKLVPAQCSGHVVDAVTHLLRTETETEKPPSVLAYRGQTRRPVDPSILNLVSGWIAHPTSGTGEVGHRTG